MDANHIKSYGIEDSFVNEHPYMYRRMINASYMPLRWQLVCRIVWLYSILVDGFSFDSGCDMGSLTPDGLEHIRTEDNLKCTCGDLYSNLSTK